jgi:hypothetical protein
MAQQTISTLPKDFKHNDDSAQILVHPLGKFLYHSDRGHNSIAVFAVSVTKGTLTPIAMFAAQGKTLHNFEIDATGPYLLAASQEAKHIVAFRIDQKTLRLASSGQVVEVGMPLCLKFVVVERSQNRRPNMVCSNRGEVAPARPSTYSANLGARGKARRPGLRWSMRSRRCRGPPL